KVIVPVSTKDELQMNIATKMYEELLAAGIEAVLDDRDERPGVKFKDADLIGFPYRITVGKTINEGNVEFVTRATGDKTAIKPEEAVKNVIEEVNKIK
ncbi:MAG: proline--tRNA ligase, partial [Candidatus Gastranaerophilales bacterium]|nr:proline--tRNA ligase [Candidatus Gastranaerophilales bacterium]